LLKSVLKTGLVLFVAIVFGVDYILNEPCWGPLQGIADSTNCIHVSWGDFSAGYFSWSDMTSSRWQVLFSVLLGAVSMAFIIISFFIRDNED
jgi:hypothetical protein